MTTTIATMRAVAYLRVSTSGQEDGYGLDVQREMVEDHAAESGWDLLEIIEETGSGAIKDDEEFSYEHRPKLLDIRARAALGEFDVVIVPNYKRLSRDPTTTAALKRYFKRHGVLLVSVAEHKHTNGDTAIGRFLERILEEVDELDRAMIEERMQAGKAMAKAAGRHSGGRVPYGYTSARGTLKPAETAKVVRRIFTEAREGRTPGRIARDLNAEAIPPPQAPRKKHKGQEREPRPPAWTPAGIRTILRNPVVTGEQAGRKNAHPAIVSRRLYNQAQAALDARRRVAR